MSRVRVRWWDTVLIVVVVVVVEYTVLAAAPTDIITLGLGSSKVNVFNCFSLIVFSSFHLNLLRSRLFKDLLTFARNAKT